MRNLGGDSSQISNIFLGEEAREEEEVEGLEARAAVVAVGVTGQVGGKMRGTRRELKEKSRRWRGRLKRGISCLRML